MQLLGCHDGLDMDLVNPDHFFANPVKHFPDGDIYNAGVDQDHEWFKAQAEEREDQGWNCDGDAGDTNTGEAPNHDIQFNPRLFFLDVLGYIAADETPLSATDVPPSFSRTRQSYPRQPSPEACNTTL